MAKSTRKTSTTRAKQSKSTKPAKTQKKAVDKPKSTSLSPFEEMDLLFDRLSRNFLQRWNWPRLGDLEFPFELKAPKVDVIDRSKEVVIRAEIPGVDKDDLEVSVTENSLTIKGQTRREVDKEEGDYHRREISTGSFQRTLALPMDVEAEKCKASFKDGLLELVFPKTPAKSSRKVDLD